VGLPARQARTPWARRGEITSGRARGGTRARPSPSRPAACHRIHRAFRRAFARRGFGVVRETMMMRAGSGRPFPCRRALSPGEGRRPLVGRSA